MQVCCVADCEGADDKDAILFKFPISRTLKTKWLKALALTSKHADQGSVCSRHFQPTDYEFARGRTKLRPNVVPTKRPNSTTPDTKEENHSSDNTDIEKKAQSISTKRKRKNDQTGTPKDSKEKPAQERELTSDIEMKELGDNEEKNMKEPGEKSDKEIKDPGESSEKEMKESRESSVKKMRETTEPDKETTVENPEKEINDTRENIEKEMKELVEKPENEMKETRETTKSDCDVNKCDVLKDSVDSVMKKDCNLKDSVGNERNKRDRIKSKKGGENSAQKSKEIESNCIISTPKPVPDSDKPEDIEELLTNYHIKQNNAHALEHLEPAQDCIDVDNDMSFPHVMEEQEPVFIEVAVQQDQTHGGDSGDCLMLLESVQVELDPSELMLHDGEYEVASDDLDGPDEPGDNNAISLLTSSDEDDVIIQEPKIDTVEVSDEDEDDQPLVKLVKKKVKKKVKRKTKLRPKNDLKEEEEIVPDMWGMYDYYCVECRFRTTDRAEFNRHRTEHTKVLLMCQVCSYMTSSEVQLAKHEKSHKELLRFQCHLCEYKASRHMSLVYHLQSHNVKTLKCTKCSSRFKNESEFLRHMLLCTAKPVELGKLFKCDKCCYRTNRPSTLKRHSKVHKKRSST